MASKHSSDSDSSAPPSPRRSRPKSIHRVSIKVPPFYRRNVTAWFKTLESQFKLSRISSQETKYHYLVSNLPEDVAALLLTDTVPEVYDDLKAEVLLAVEKSKQEKINELFDLTDIGDDKPSIFLRKIIAKMEQCGLRANDDEITQKLLRCLPPSVSTPLRAFQDLPPHRVAALADSMMISPPVAPVHHVSQLHSSQRRHDHDPDPQVSPQLKPFHQGQKPKICRAHIFYGSRARSCRPWCQFPNSSSSGSRPRVLSTSEHTPSQSRTASPDRRHEGN